MPASTPNKRLVMKFGGTSVGQPSAMAAAVEIVKQARREWQQVVVVTSALAGVTNLLLDGAIQAVSGDTNQLLQAEQALLAKHEAIAAALITSDTQRLAVMQAIARLTHSFTELCHAISILGEATPRALDAVASIGERMSVRLLAAILQANQISAGFVEANEIIITDEQFQAAHPDFLLTAEKVRERLLPMLESGLIPVVTGFIGATPNGIITTLGRGGSDYSASILGAVLTADEVWIWTDVDGVMTADPRLVPESQTLPVISYSEIAELAYFGAKVLHPKTIRPIIEANIGLRICNTFNPQRPGTRLIANNANVTVEKERVIKAVTAIQKQRLITIEGRGMLGVPGVAARTFAAVASTNTSVPLITQASSEQSICFSIPAEATTAVLAALQKTFESELARRDIDRIWATEEVSIITTVGYGMRYTPGIAGKIFTQLGNANVNVLAIAHGSSDVSISMVIASADTANAVRSLHRLIVP